MAFYTGIIFAAAAAALSILNVLLLASITSDSFKLWPVPTTKSWRRYTFWPLFRGGLGLTIVYCFVTAHWPEGLGDTLSFAVGVICALIGTGLTIYGYFDLGIENTYCADDGLITNGLYRYSRNPQYVASMLAYAGGALANGSLSTVILCTLAILVYVILPFTEEPWLQRAYGDVYLDYKRRTPRFL